MWLEPGALRLQSADQSCHGLEGLERVTVWVPNVPAHREAFIHCSPSWVAALYDELAVTRDRTMDRGHMTFVPGPQNTVVKLQGCLPVTACHSSFDECNLWTCTACSKKYHDFNRIPFPQILAKAIIIWTCCSQHVVSIDKKVKRFNGFLAWGEIRNCLILLQEQTAVAISPTLRWVWHGISWSFPVHPHFQECETFRCTVHSVIHKYMIMGEETLHPELSPSSPYIPAHSRS